MVVVSVVSVASVTVATTAAAIQVIEAGVSTEVVLVSEGFLVKQTLFSFGVAFVNGTYCDVQSNGYWES